MKSVILSFIGMAICLEADSNGKREMRVSYAKRGRTLDMGDGRIEMRQKEATHAASSL